MAETTTTNESVEDENTSLRTQIGYIITAGKIGFLCGTMVLMVFLSMLLLGAGESSYTITNQMVFFYMFLSYSSGFGLVIFLAIMNYGNTWVRRIFILSLFGLPLALEFL